MILSSFGLDGSENYDRFMAEVREGTDRLSQVVDECLQYGSSMEARRALYADPGRAGLERALNQAMNGLVEIKTRSGDPAAMARKAHTTLQQTATLLVSTQDRRSALEMVLLSVVGLVTAKPEYSLSVRVETQHNDDGTPRSVYDFIFELSHGKMEASEFRTVSFSADFLNNAAPGAVASVLGQTVSELAARVGISDLFVT
jgi:hypothetical protein